MGESGVHLELSDTPAGAETLAGHLATMRLASSWRVRRGTGVVTLKRVDDVVTLLRWMGASSTVLDLESRLVARQLQGHLNRVINAESANLRRSVRAAQRQLEAIRELQADGRMARLTPEEREVAAARVEAPEASLAGLSATTGIGRSRVQRALARILALAEDPASPARRPADRDNAPMRPVIIAGNWKMNGLPTEAGPLATGIAEAMPAPEVTRVLCPPFVSLAAVGAALAGTGVAVGAQDVHAEPAGAYTGGISAAMLSGLATWAIVGHSERRRDQGETDEVIGRKLIRCSEAGLRPILCVGELLAEREAGRAVATVQAQLHAALSVVLAAGPFPTDLVVAYEPVWAIGTGRTARGADAAAMADAIRTTAATLGAPEGGASLPVLYGGSVTSASAGEFLAEPALDGALVGGASLKADEMAGIVARAAVTARARLDPATPA